MQKGQGENGRKKYEKLLEKNSGWLEQKLYKILIFKNFQWTWMHYIECMKNAFV